MRQPCCAVSRGRSTWNAWWTSAPRSKAQEVRMQLGCVGIKRMGLGRKRRVGPRAGPRGSCRVGGPAVVLRAESAPVREGQCAGCHMPNPDCHDQMQQWRPAWRSPSETAQVGARSNGWMVCCCATLLHISFRLDAPRTEAIFSFFRRRCFAALGRWCPCTTVRAQGTCRMLATLPTSRRQIRLSVGAPTMSICAAMERRGSGSTPSHLAQSGGLIIVQSGMAQRVLRNLWSSERETSVRWRGGCRLATSTGPPQCRRRRQAAARASGSLGSGLGTTCCACFSDTADQCVEYGGGIHGETLRLFAF